MNGRQVVDHFLLGDHVGVFGVEIEQVGLVDLRVTISAGIAHDDGNEAVLAGVDRGGSNASAGGDAGVDQRVDAH